jgi:gamma-glutamylcyclotransferase (GGCT)/AIG2-like uncharacterized protein YtfP
MRYFAYGSNLDIGQMRTRCPSAAFQCRAILQWHALVFPRTSRTRNCGVSSIELREGAQVWGVVFNLTSKDLESLDRSEGYDLRKPLSHNAYNRDNVLLFVEGDLSKPIHAQTYMATPQPNPLLPSAEYLGLIISGAEAFSLPADYVSGLRAIRTAG